jgi:hypothetical protein
MIANTARTVKAKNHNFPISNAPKNAWLASLSLEFSLTASGSQLTRTIRNGPLTVQKAFYPEGHHFVFVPKRSNLLFYYHEQQVPYAYVQASVFGCTLIPY